MQQWLIIIRRLFSPAISPASLVAWRCASWNMPVPYYCFGYFVPRNASASVLSFWRIIGWNFRWAVFLSTSNTFTSLLGPFTTYMFYVLHLLPQATHARGFTPLSSHKRLMLYTVFSGLTIACRFCYLSTAFTCFTYATTEGIRRAAIRTRYYFRFVSLHHRHYTFWSSTGLSYAFLPYSPPSKWIIFILICLYLRFLFSGIFCFIFTNHNWEGLSSLFF